MSTVIVAILVVWKCTLLTELEPWNKSAPESIAKEIGERRASSTVTVKVFSPSHVTKRTLPLPPCAYAVVEACSTEEVVAVSI